MRAVAAAVCSRTAISLALHPPPPAPCPPPPLLTRIHGPQQPHTAQRHAPTNAIHRKSQPAGLLHAPPPSPPLRTPSEPAPPVTKVVCCVTSVPIGFPISLSRQVSPQSTAVVELGLGPWAKPGLGAAQKTLIPSCPPGLPHSDVLTWNSASASTTTPISAFDASKFGRAGTCDEFFGCHPVSPVWPVSATFACQMLVILGTLGVKGEAFPLNWSPNDVDSLFSQTACEFLRIPDWLWGACARAKMRDGH